VAQLLVTGGIPQLQLDLALPICHRLILHLDLDLSEGRLNGALLVGVERACLDVLKNGGFAHADISAENHLHALHSL